MKTLVIIDFQHDFANPKGSLYVNGSELVEDELVKYIYTNKSIDEVIFTIDWHSPKHCSFKNNGGEWPSHCIQFTEGAGISKKLMNACIDKGLRIKVFKKGNCDTEEEYGAFDVVSLYNDGGIYRFSVNNITGSSQQFIDNSDIEICGIALDYCVLNTAHNLAKYSSELGINVTLLKDYCPCIGDKEAALKEIENFGVKIV
jgi:nicotinamidase-related amidase